MVIEKIRTLTLLVAISVLGYGGYFFLSTFKTTSESIDIQFDDDGLDVKIKNFKIAHENAGRNDWKLKAALAQINQKKETTKLNNVEYVFINDEMRKFKVYADFGTLSNKTNDLSLEGNVKMLIETGIIKDQITNNTISKKKNKNTNG
jgi:LPS export ABC transporter protein LptC